jgi:hemerythrin-like metal-binding protein
MSSLRETKTWRLEWSDALSVRNPEIDAEHRHFIQLVNDFNEAVTTRMSMEVVKNRLQAILEDAAAHFAHEEVLFRAWDYPAAGEHAQQHARITFALRDIMQHSEHGGVEYEWIEAGLAIKQILIEHILTEDMLYRDYCLASGCVVDASVTPIIR